jgi:hypothetical protein
VTEARITMRHIRIRNLATILGLFFAAVMALVAWLR